MSKTRNAAYTRKCIECGELKTVEVNEGDYNDWLNGELIQQVMPYLTADERELLMSGICGTCFDEIFAED